MIAAVDQIAPKLSRPKPYQESLENSSEYQCIGAKKLTPGACLATEAGPGYTPNIYAKKLLGAS
jgi:hypothetical protein